MSNEQKMREAFEARMTDNGKWPRAVEQGRNGCYLLAKTENAWVEWQACAEALATTEQAAVLTEVADLGVVPKIIKPFTPAQRKRLWDNSKEHHKDAASFTGFERIVTLTERAHQIGTVLATTEPEPTGKQSLQVEPAVNQQLTTEPLDERAAFESEMRSRHGWNNSYFTQSNDGGYLSNRATHAYIGWQARAALSEKEKS